MTSTNEPCFTGDYRDHKGQIFALFHTRARHPLVSVPREKLCGDTPAYDLLRWIGVPDAEIGRAMHKSTTVYEDLVAWQTAHLKLYNGRVPAPHPLW